MPTAIPLPTGQQQGANLALRPFLCGGLAAMRNHRYRPSREICNDKKKNSVAARFVAFFCVLSTVLLSFSQLLVPSAGWLAPCMCKKGLCWVMTACTLGAPCPPSTPRSNGRPRRCYFRCPRRLPGEYFHFGFQTDDQGIFHQRRNPHSADNPAG